MICVSKGTFIKKGRRMISMTIEQMIERKRELGYTNQKLSELSGVPIPTIQKIFSNKTKFPREDTIKALSEVLENKQENDSNNFSYIRNKDYSNYELHEEAAFNVKKPINKSNNYENKDINDYLALPEGTRIELIDGKFYDMAAPTTPHQDIAGGIYVAFYNHIKSNKGACKTYISPIDVQLDRDDKTMVQPDVVIVCNKENITRPRIVGAPDLVVEVLSPSNFMMDIVIKLHKYNKAGVREYWIVVPEEKKTIVYRLENSIEDVKIYDFDEEVPVGIWDGKCKVKIGEFYEEI